ncbi:MAG: phytanoyl-CoA dioxygenase family protein [Polyangiaceae bacterium]|nr:phytanoyl-CoA dioxygenase family protein [Polyangiaceae bacterium]
MIAAKLAALGPVPLFAPEVTRLEETTSVTPNGLAWFGLLYEAPGAATQHLEPLLLEVLHRLLGAEVRLELAAALISDSQRPFFPWHSHVGGVDTGVYSRHGAWPAVQGIERVVALRYLDELDDETGPLLIYPRRLGDAPEPPHDLHAEAWPGQVELKVRRGSVVLLDQCTWHAARARRGAGHRTLVGSYFRSASQPPPEWVDHGLGKLASLHPELAPLVSDAAPGGERGR